VVEQAHAGRRSGSSRVRQSSRAWRFSLCRYSLNSDNPGTPLIERLPVLPPTCRRRARRRPVTRIAYSVAARPIDIGVLGWSDLADDAVSDGLGHAPPADDLDAERRKGRRLAHRGAPEPETCGCSGSRAPAAPSCKREIVEVQVAAMLQRHGPEAAGGKIAAGSRRFRRPRGSPSIE